MAVSVPPKPSLTPPAERESQPDPDALFQGIRRRQRRCRLGIAVLLLGFSGAAVVYFGVIRPGGSQTNSTSSGPQWLCIANLAGWQSRVVSRPGTPPALLLTNFRFGRTDYLYGHTDSRLRWLRGGSLISIANWTQAVTQAIDSQYRPASTLRIAASDFASFEGVRDLGQEHVRLNGQLLGV